MKKLAKWLLIRAGFGHLTQSMSICPKIGQFRRNITSDVVETTRTRRLEMPKYPSFALKYGVSRLKHGPQRNFVAKRMRV